MHGFFIIPLGGRRGGKKDHKVFQGEWVGEANHANGVDIINAKALYSINTKYCMIPMRTILTTKHRGLFSSPSGVREGKERPHGLSGGVGGVLGMEIKKMKKRHFQRHPVINKLVSQASQVVIFFLRCLTHRISQAKTKNSPSVPPFGRLRLLRESVAGERTAGGKRQNKRCSLGHRTMRQGSKLSLFAANLRHGRKVRPCSRPLGAQGGVFGYSGGKREQEKRPPMGLNLTTIARYASFASLPMAHAPSPI